ncbi:MAG: SBBP repeat-containing protein, partial [Bacteroidota bacterium]
MKNKNYISVLLLFWSMSAMGQEQPGWQWAHRAGLTQQNHGNSIATDGNGNSYITGGQISPIAFGNDTLSNSGFFVVKYDPSGNVLWAKSCAGGYGVGTDIAVDANGNSYIVGNYSSNIIFGSITLLLNGTLNSDIFVVKYDPNGNVLWARGAGGLQDENATSIAIDANG